MHLNENVFFVIIEAYYFLDTFSSLYCNIFLLAVPKSISDKISENGAAWRDK